MPLLDEAATYLDAQTTAFTLLSGTGGNLVKARLVDHDTVPDTLTALYETGGSPPNWQFGSTSPVYETCGLQILSRSTSYATAHNRAFQAYRILGGIRNQRMPYSSQSSGVLWLDCQPDQPPFGIGPDPEGRPMVSVNFTVRKERRD